MHLVPGIWGRKFYRQKGYSSFNFNPKPSKEIPLHENNSHPLRAVSSDDTDQVMDFSVFPLNPALRWTFSVCFIKIW
jgi:hypothetical protein